MNTVRLLVCANSAHFVKTAASATDKKLCFELSSGPIPWSFEGHGGLGIHAGCAASGAKKDPGWRATRVWWTSAIACQAGNPLESIVSRLRDSAMANTLAGVRRALKVIMLRTSFLKTSFVAFRFQWRAGRTHLVRMSSQREAS
jgi:hypothetical protein